ncbi:MAG: response regulator [Rhodocyclaceae bacterium]|jgi:signal transduction histidine kinase/CheY-like chemotaxis protein/HPt (histidine-containing phosphotransfer) domain-containing protein|nr:response regulator [Rhodocyclaceae bacterium]
MPTTHTVELVRRQYNNWVANESIEDYALRYSPSSFRKWSPAVIGATMIGTNSALSYEAIGALLLLDFGFANAMWAMVFATLAIFAAGWPICHYSAKHSIDMDLLTRAAGFGYVGSTFTSLIYASFTFIFLAVETAIMAQAVKLCFGIPLWLGYIICSVVVIPIVFYGVTAINRFHQWTQPIWLILLITPFYLVLTRDPNALESMTHFTGGVSKSSGFDLFHFGIAAGISFSLIAQIGEQVDYLRFMPERTKKNRWSWWLNMMTGGPGWVFIAFIKQMGGAMLAAGAVVAGLAIVDAKEPIQIFERAFSYALENPQTALLISALFVIISELKVNVTNAYAGSLAWSNFFSRVTHSHPGRVVWLVFNSAIALLLMELDLFEAMNSVLGMYSNIAVAWICAVVADLVINKPFGFSPPIVEFKRAHLYDVNPVGVVSMVVASVISTIAFSGLLGDYAQAYSWLIAAVIAFILSPVIAILTKGKYYIARPSHFAPGSNVMVGCTVCSHHYAEADSAHCPHHDGTICSLCCTLEATCKDVCKPRITTPLDHYRAWVGRALHATLRREVSTATTLRVANFSLIWSVMLGIIWGILWITLPAGIKEIDGAVVAMFSDYRLRVFVGAGLLASLSTWWIVLVSESRDLAENEMRVARDRAEEATKAKSDFLANMSHEIRTPMNAIIGMSHLALQTGLDSKQRNYISKVNRAAGNLLGIINDILDFSKIEAGKLSVEKIDFQLQEVMSHLADLVGMKAEDKGLKLSFTSAPGVPAALVGDPLRLGQILINLGNNAVKFTDTGEIVVGVETVESNAETVTLHFWVQDSGIGMTPEQCSRMFQSFSQADASTTRKYGGTGLGLAISKNLVELMEGRIWVDSEAGKGSSFHFHARFGRQINTGADEADLVIDSLSNSRATEARHTSEAMQKLAGCRVLLVEDNAMNQELAQELLGNAQMQVVVANHGQEALDILARDAAFDGILMDCQMPVMDGYTATRAIRQQAAFKDIPIIAMTANAMAGDKEKVIAAGMNDHIAKPLNVADMFATLARWLSPGAAPVGSAAAAVSATSAGQATAVPESALRAGLANLPGITLAAGLAVTMGNVELYHRLLMRFRDSQAHFAREFDAARRSADGAAPARCAHTLKGTAGNIGAKRIQAAASALEQGCLNDHPATQINDLLARALSELEIVIEGLARLPQRLPSVTSAAETKHPSGTKSPNARTANPLAQVPPRMGIVTPLLDLLAAQLIDAEASALETSELLTDALRNTPLEAQMAAIEKLVGNFEFEKAEAALRLLRG